MFEDIVKICDLKYQYEELLLTSPVPSYRKNLTVNNAVWFIENSHRLTYVNKNTIDNLVDVCNDFLNMENVNDSKNRS